MPRELDDLPYARFLEAFDGEVELEGDYDCARIRDLEFTELDARSSRFNESALSDLAFTGGTLSYTRFASVWLRRVTMTGTSLSDTSWMDAEIIDSAWAGVELAGAGLRRVTFHDCKFDAVNFRGAALREVTFHDCVLREADFGGARLRSVAFPGSRIDRLAVHRTTMTEVDFRQAATFTVAEGIEALRGAIINRVQLMELAPALAAAVGLQVPD
ncbi:pentapeptide repeat-containing protein [Nocardia sp. CNY236]|uniref:pentapeptide repeat-containing protein n=1 Tax=Nocardia sp. CNY236 TaxID=1169152 RepID=UPI0003F95B4E|nr:pentapeptide repeat-containing protein [Nocardia sp. CNY236]